MQTISKEDLMTQFVDRLAQEDHEKFIQESLEYIRKRREAKERKGKETEQPAESGSN